jgi:predicted transcriptional regulator
VLTTWIQNFSYDFKESKTLKNELLSFIDEMDLTKMDHSAQLLRNLINEKANIKETLLEQKIEEKLTIAISVDEEKKEVQSKKFTQKFQNMFTSQRRVSESNRLFNIVFTNF